MQNYKIKSKLNFRNSLRSQSIHLNFSKKTKFFSRKNPNKRFNLVLFKTFKSLKVKNLLKKKFINDSLSIFLKSSSTFQKKFLISELNILLTKIKIVIKNLIENKIIIKNFMKKIRVKKKVYTLSHFGVITDNELEKDECQRFPFIYDNMKLLNHDKQFTFFQKSKLAKNFKKSKVEVLIDLI